MARNDLLRQLIASPHALPPPQPRNLLVSPQGQLPPQARFGPMSPGQVTNTPFSGAVARGGPLNLVHPTGPADFQAPRYSPLTAVSPQRSILTALAPIIGATLMGGSGATAPAAFAAAPTPPFIPRPGLGVHDPNAVVPPGLGQHLPSTPVPAGLGQHSPSSQPVPLGALIASLAQQGRKVSPGGSAYTKAF